MKKLWRYISYEKFESILETESIYFCLASKFEDTFEGQFAWGDKGYREYNNNIDKLMIKHGGGMPKEDFIANHLNDISHLRERVHISCWHYSEHESEAMWNLYCKENPKEGIVISTSMSNMLETFPVSKGFTQKAVAYNNSYHVKDYNPQVEIFFHKRKSFEHEKEYRITYLLPFNLTYPHPSGSPYRIECNKFICEIRLHPFVEDEYKNKISKLLDKHQLSHKLQKSEIEINPLLSIEKRDLIKGVDYMAYQLRLKGKLPS